MTSRGRPPVRGSGGRPRHRIFHIGTAGIDGNQPYGSVAGAERKAADSGQFCALSERGHKGGPRFRRLPGIERRPPHVRRAYDRIGRAASGDGAILGGQGVRPPGRLEDVRHERAGGHRPDRLHRLTSPRRGPGGEVAAGGVRFPQRCPCGVLKRPLGPGSAPLIDSPPACPAWSTGIGSPDACRGSRAHRFRAPGRAGRTYRRTARFRRAATTIRSPWPTSPGRCGGAGRGPRPHGPALRNRGRTPGR